MNLFTPMRMRVKKDVVVRIHRRLKGKGLLNISEGQEVIPSDIIGTSQVSSGFRILKLAEQLSVAPAEVEKYLKRSLGQRIYQGELLAERSSGLFGGKKIITAPTDGVLDFLNSKTGEVRMTFLPKKEDLPASVYGIVENVDKEKGQVIIKTQANLVYGIFGSGKIRDGILQIIGKRDELVEKSLISQKLDGQIIVGGSLVLRDAISAAISAGVAGIITGGINAKDYQAMAGSRLIFPKKLDTDMGISIVVCEGFGSAPIGEDIYEILKKFEGKFVSIDGNANVIYLPIFESKIIDKVKKTHLPPIQDQALISYSFNKVDEQIAQLKVGFIVRVTGNSYVGEQGQIVGLDKTETIIPSGVKTHLATIATKRRKIQVPVANIEVIDYSF